MAKNKQKYYAILSKKDNYLHGVFPFSEDGRKQANIYLNKKIKNKKDFYIKKK